MAFVLVFGVLLLLAVLISERARHTVLSTSVLFLIGGAVLGNLGLGWLALDPESAAVSASAQLALFTILIVDGAELPCRDVVRAWSLPGRALLLGLPLTIAALAVAARAVLGLGWVEAFLLGAVLSPTDPVLVRAILDHEAVPARLRQLLAVESGLNDGLALPAIVVLLPIAASGSPAPLRALGEALGGVALGIAVPLGFAWIERARWLEVARSHQALVGVAIATTVAGLAAWSGANAMLAAFTAGITLASTHEVHAREFVAIGGPLSEAIKLAALLVFAASVQLDLLGLGALVFAALALLAARPAALLLAFVGSGLPRGEWLAAAWFGPKGFASLFYAILALHAGTPHGRVLLEVTGLVIGLSVIAHSSTDALVARAFARRAEPVEPAAPAEQGS